MLSRGTHYVVALAVVLGASTAAAQRATANLTPVESGRVDASTDAETREMCLREGAYVLAFVRGADPDEGGALVATPTPYSVVASLTLREADQHGWAWRPFTVGPDYTCFQLGAVNGRARVYQLRVGVDW